MDKNMEDIFNTELGRKMLALTKASFKVSDLIPDLVVREKIKSQILNVYKLFCGKNHSELLKEIDVLDGFLFLAGQMNLIKEEHSRALRNGFLVFKSRIKKEAVKSAPELNDRQKKILDKFQNKETLKLSEVMDFFPGVSERTIRNELSSLIGLKKITRSGKGNGSFYKIIRQ